MKTLAVTGDDFGFSRGVNRAIAEAHDRGILTRASLMIAGDAVEEAVALARARPGLAVGLHLVVVDGRAALAAPEIPRLVDAGGRFRGGPVRAGLRYQFSREARLELAREVRTQLERFRETGLALAHVDGHHHMHLHPVVLEIVLDLAREFRIPAVRLPSEELSLALALDRRGLAVKVVSACVYSLLRRHGERRAREVGIDFCERVYGLLATGRVTEEYLLGLIPRIRAGRVELYCHPAVALPGEPGNGPPGAGPEELAALLSPRVRQAVEACGFALGSPSAASQTRAS